MDFVINPLTIEERKYTYAQSSQLKGPEVSVICVVTSVQGNSFIPLGLSITAD